MPVEVIGAFFLKSRVLDPILLTVFGRELPVMVSLGLSSLYSRVIITNVYITSIFKYSLRAVKYDFHTTVVRPIRSSRSISTVGTVELLTSTPSKRFVRIRLIVYNSETRQSE